MNTLDKSYTNLLQDILDNGVTKQDRTGTGTKSVFGRQIRHKMSEGFPLLTTKQLHFKSIVTELLWFLRGDTNIKYLVDNGCNIWNGDCYKNYLNKRPSQQHSPYYTQKDFIEKIKTDDVFAGKWGDLGPIYGTQWREWKTYNNDEPPHLDIDQIKNSIELLKTDPDSRRNIVSAWNVGEIDNMVLPPCHYGFQLYTRELTFKEQETLPFRNPPIIEWDDLIEHNKKEVPTRAISLMWNQRSVDTFLGLPFNIASYGLLLEIIAKEVNMIPDELIGNLGDVHLYSNHIEQAKEQIGKELTWEERRNIAEETLSKKEFQGIQSDNGRLTGYWQGFGYISPFTDKMIHRWLDNKDIPKRTREPFDLPTLNEIPSYLCKNDDFECYIPKDFTLNNYKSHSKIKGKLSN